MMGQTTSFMLAGSLLMGMPMAVSIVVMPNLVRSVFGEQEFESRYKLLSILVNLSSNFSYSLIGWMISVTSYQDTLAVGALVTAVALLLSAIAFAIRKRSFVYE